MEFVRLRIKDVDFDRGEILIRDDKGAKDRVAILRQSLVPALCLHVQRVGPLWQADKVSV